MTVIIEVDVAGFEISRFYFVRLKLAASIDQGIQKIPNLHLQDCT
jgi:hypothetical protein